ncbi:MAG: glycerophosphodiester phosphodiesterase family protein [Actinomycetota bacterium]|nr:glycerophosphodiester phosphodiesterase family protein [Actinomycetota bacterium]
MKWLVSCVAMVAACLLGVPSPAAAVPGGCDPNFEVVDHRGAHNQRDENTVPAIRLGARRGQSIEIDVSATSDGHLILMHDNRIDRTTNGEGLVAEMTFEEIRTYRTVPDGEIIPTLDEALTAAARYPVDVYLDVKNRTDEVLTDVAQIIRNHGMEESALVTSWTGKMNVLTDDILLQYKPEGEAPTVAEVQQKDASSVGLQARQMSDALVNELRLANIEVHSRLVSTPAGWDRVTQYRIEGALTNKPNELEEYCTPVSIG